ncbi:hypothetical protein AOLI_G00017820 [Acnodon oligacanthus]
MDHDNVKPIIIPVAHRQLVTVTMGERQRDKERAYPRVPPSMKMEQAGTACSCLKTSLNEQPDTTLLQGKEGERQ